MKLEHLGWNAHFDKEFQPYYEHGWVPARVSRQERNRWTLRYTDGERIADLSGKYRHAISRSADYPTVGDWVAASIDDKSSNGVIQALLPRTSAFSRKAADSGGMPGSGGRTDEQVLAANIDTVFLVNGLDHDFNVRRIERYLASAYDSGAVPVIVLNKADLCDDTDSVRADVEAVAFGVDILIMSAASGSGVGQLEKYVGEGKTVVFLGSSGVGKSSLINRLLGHDELKTGAVREDDSRGRHTTTWRELAVLPEGGVLIDTPGLRELQAWIDAESLAHAFEDIVSLSTECKFRDCRHENEPGCAVKAAVDSGQLDSDRLANYQKLQRELERLEIRKNGLERHMEKVAGRKFAKMVKEVYKHKKDRR